MKNEVKNGIIIAVIVLLIVGVVYLITAVFMTGEIGNKKRIDSGSEVSSSDYISYSNMILASNVFTQKESEYMVMFVSNDELNDTLKGYLNSYSSSDGKIKLYVVSTDDVVNKFVKSNDSNETATNYSELKINKNTLIIIKNGKISSYLTDNDEIIEKLK